MKKITTLFMLAMPAVLFAQQKFVVKGTIQQANPHAKIFMFYEVPGKSVTDSTDVKNGEFEFSGVIGEITLGTLVMDHNGVGLEKLDKTKADMARLYLEQGTVRIQGGDSLANAQIGGSRANDDFMKYIRTTTKVNENARALNAEYNMASAEKKNSAEFVKEIQGKQIALQQQINQVNNRFITENPDASISLRILVDGFNADNYPDPAVWEPKFLKLSKNLRTTKSALSFQNALNALKLVGVGAVAPDFIQSGTNESPVKLSSFRGKYVLLDFWASWCGPCRNENPNLLKAYDHFKNKNFTILGVSLDNPGKKEDWIKAIASDGLTWTQVSDLKGGNNAAALLYQVKVIPQNLLIDPNGKIIAKNIFGDALENKLTEVLGR